MQQEVKGERKVLLTGWRQRQLRAGPCRLWSFPKINGKCSLVVQWLGFGTITRTYSKWINFPRISLVGQTDPKYFCFERTLWMEETAQRAKGPTKQHYPSWEGEEN